MEVPTTVSRRKILTVAGIGAGLILIRPKIGYGDIGLKGQTIYAAETTGRTNEIVVLTQTENGNSHLRTADIGSDGSTDVGRRVDAELNTDFTALDLASDQTQAAAIIGTLTKTVPAENTNDFDSLTSDQQERVQEEPFHPYGIPQIGEVTTNHPALTETLTASEITTTNGFGILAGRTKLGSVTLEVVLRPFSEEADHLSQVDVVVDNYVWTLETSARLLGTASVYARGNERPYVVADTEDQELLIWQADNTGWTAVESLTDAEPNSARLSNDGELVAWRNNGTVLEPVVLRDNVWKAGGKDQRQDASAGAIPVRNGDGWLTTNSDGAVKAIEVEPG